MSEGAVWVSHAAHTDFLMTQKCSLTGCVCLLTCGCEMCLLACGCKTCLLPCGYNMCPLACGCKMCLLACGCQMCLLPCGCQMCLLACGCKVCLLACGCEMCLLACGCQLCLLACGSKTCLLNLAARCLLACGCTGWPLAAYVLIGRDDIAATVQASMALPPEGAPPQSSPPLASPVSPLALATPLHHGAGGGASPKRPSLGRTPIRQPQLGTLQGEAHHAAIVLLSAALIVHVICLPIAAAAFDIATMLKWQKP